MLMHRPLRLRPRVAVTLVSLAPAAQVAMLDLHMHGSRTILFVATALLCAGLVIAGLVYYQYRSRIIFESAASKNIIDSTLAGDTSGVREHSNILIASNPGNADTAIWARAMQAQTAYNAATTLDERIAAVHLMEENYTEAQSPRIKALSINMIVTATIMFARENDISDVIFTGETFRAFASSSVEASRRNLLDESIRIYPTPEAYYLLGILDARRINMRLRPGSSVPLDPSSMEQLRTRARNIEDLIGKADAIVAREPVRADSPYDALERARQKIFRALGLEGAALVDSSLVTAAESGYKDVIELSESMKDAEGQVYPTFKVNAAYARLYTARLFVAVGGKDNVSKVQGLLSQFVNDLVKSPDVYEEIFAMFSWLKNAPKVEENTGAAAHRYRQQQTYVAMANVSQEFKDFLLAQGWNKNLFAQ